METFVGVAKMARKRLQSKVKLQAYPGVRLTGLFSQREAKSGETSVSGKKG
jgi:hypothetical protein